MKRKRLGEVLHERGHISASDLTAAIEEQQQKLVHLGELLHQKGTIRKTDLTSALEEVTRVPYLDCRKETIPDEIRNLIPREMAASHSVLPVSWEGPKLVVVMAEPQNLNILTELRFLTGVEISPRLGFRSEILEVLDSWPAPTSGDDYEEGVDEEVVTFGRQASSGAASAESTAPQMIFLSATSRENNLEAIREFQAEMAKQKTPAVRIVSALVTAGVTKEASDIHIEPQAKDTCVRIRVDGILRELQQIPHHLQVSVVSRVKILADLDIAERRTPQDGRFYVQVGEKKFDVRVSTLPTQFGEKVVMRLLSGENVDLTFENLGMSGQMIEAMHRVLAQPQGILLVTGPTGSGKSSTLYAALRHLRSATVNIVTVEDPIEYVLSGINQVQVNTKAGLTFAGCLRSILRQDPNIILVGEIRDKETAEIAMKAAQTGHLVLSTLHTNDSVAAVSRLLDLGVQGFLISASVSGILAQRLVRKLCACHKRVPRTQEYGDQLLEIGLLEPEGEMCIPVGCAVCDFTGYKGRVGVYEFLLFNDPIRAAVNAGANSEELRALAISAGTRPLQGDAIDKVRRGITTLDEVMRVVPFEKLDEIVCEQCARGLVPGFLFCPWCGHERQTTPSTAAAEAEERRVRR